MKKCVSQKWGFQENQITHLRWPAMNPVYRSTVNQEALTSDRGGQPKTLLLVSFVCFSLIEQRLKVAEVECDGLQMSAASDI